MVDTGESEGAGLPTIPPEGIPIGSRVVMRRFGRQVGIFVGSAAICYFDAADKVGRDLAIANLSATDLAGDTEIAAAFRVHRNTVRRMAAKLAAGGVGALLPATVPPPVRIKLTEEAKAIVAQRAGLAPPSEIAAEIAERTGVVVTLRHIRRLVAGLAQTQPRLDDDDPPPGSSPGGGGGDGGAEPGGGDGLLADQEAGFPGAEPSTDRAGGVDACAGPEPDSARGLDTSLEAGTSPLGRAPEPET